jgi:hypothetical protein
VITNLQTCGLTLVRQILRCHTNRAEWEKSVVSPYFRRPPHCDV